MFFFLMWIVVSNVNYIIIKVQAYNLCAFLYVYFSQKVKFKLMDIYSVGLWYLWNILQEIPMMIWTLEFGTQDRKQARDRDLKDINMQVITDSTQ